MKSLAKLKKIKGDASFREFYRNKDNKLITLVEWPQLIADTQGIKFIALSFNYLNDLNDRSVNIKV